MSGPPQSLAARAVLPSKLDAFAEQPWLRAATLLNNQPEPAARFRAQRALALSRLQGAALERFTEDRARVNPTEHGEDTLPFYTLDGAARRGYAGIPPCVRRLLRAFPSLFPAPRFARSPALTSFCLCAAQR